MMNPPNADVLDLKEEMGELFNIMQGLTVGQKAIAERLERIENWLRMGKTQGEALSSGVKKPSGGIQHKKEVESSDGHAKRGKDRYHPYANSSGSHHHSSGNHHHREHRKLGAK